MPMEKDDAATGPHAARRLSWFGAITLSLDRLNKGNVSGFSYLRADSGVVSSAAVAHRAHSASPRSAVAGRRGALLGGGCPEMQPVCSQQPSAVMKTKNCKYMTCSINPNELYHTANT